jgi:hypothetical protein
MRHATHTTQVYSPVGGAYVSESHGDGFAFEPKKRSIGTTTTSSPSRLKCKKRKRSSPKRRNPSRLSPYKLPLPTHGIPHQP